MSENGTETKDLTPKQRLALGALALGNSATEAGKAAGTSRTTVYRWLQDPRFVAELRKVDGEALKGLGRKILALSDQAAAALADCLKPDMPASIRLRAAAIVAERGPALAELTAIVERLEALEGVTYGQQNA